VALAGLKLAACVAFILYGGGRVIPWLLQKVEDAHSRELFTLSILAVAPGIG
jgi:monovalent cation:H+ antiporter-2, CPA2 family